MGKRVEDTIFFISDCHYNHKNIIGYCERPFKDAEEMNERILDNVNSVVGKDDKLFDLGDFCFGTLKEIRGFVSRYKCKNVSLILGNHDRFKPSQYMDAGFTFASRFPIIYHEFLILSHSPVFIGPGPYFNLHGHTHQNQFDLASKTHLNLCVENWNYTPISLSMILDHINCNVNTGKTSKLYKTW